MMTILHKENLLIQWLAEPNKLPIETSLASRVCRLRSEHLDDVFTKTRIVKSAIQSDLLGVLRALPLEVHGTSWNYCL